jgi:hypothetical protein
MFKLKIEKELVDFGSGIGKTWVDKESMVNDEGVEIKPNGLGGPMILFVYKDKDLSFQFQLGRTDNDEEKIDASEISIVYPSRITLEKYREITRNIEEAVLAWSCVSEVFNWPFTDENRIKPIKHVGFVIMEWSPVVG